MLKQGANASSDSKPRSPNIDIPMSSGSSLPPELWRSIFRHAVHVPLLLDTGWDYEPDDKIWEGWLGCWSIDLDNRTRCSIVQVCRGWKELVAEFLYEVVRVTASTPQVCARLGVLADVFKASASASTHGYGWWTKRINCDVEILQSQEYAQPLFSLLEQCHNLEIFSVSRGSAPTWVQTHLAQVFESRFSHSLRRLEFRVQGGDKNVPIAHASVIPRIRLTSLCITVLPEHLNYALHSSLEDINTLTLYFPSYLDKSIFPWFFPCLKTLSLHFARHRDFPVLAPFIERHRKTLSNLLFDRTYLGFHNLTSHARTLTLGIFELKELGSSAREGSAEMLPMGGLSHLGVIGGMRSTAALYDGIIDALEGPKLPDLRVLRLPDARIQAPATWKTSRWRKAIELCQQHNVRMEDKDGHLLALGISIIGHHAQRKVNVGQASVPRCTRPFQLANLRGFDPF